MAAPIKSVVITMFMLVGWNLGGPIYERDNLEQVTFYCAPSQFAKHPCLRNLLSNPCVIETNWGQMYAKKFGWWDN